MGEKLEVLSSPFWWISVVIVGIVINLAASYLRRLLDTQFSRISTRWRLRSKKRREAHQALVDKLRKSEHEQIMTSMTELRTRFDSILFLILAGFLGIIGYLLLILDAPIIFMKAAMIITSFGFFVSYLDHREALRLKSLIAESRQKVDEWTHKNDDQKMTPEHEHES